MESAFSPLLFFEKIIEDDKLSGIDNTGRILCSTKPPSRASFETTKTVCGRAKKVSLIMWSHISCTIYILGKLVKVAFLAVNRQDGSFRRFGNPLPVTV